MLRWMMLLLALLWTQELRAGELTLVFSGKELAGQTVLLSVFAAPDNFPAGEAARKVKVHAEGTTLEVRLPELPPGGYAVSAYCDRNGNGQLDRSWLGRPTEPYGFSRNARGQFGPPVWSEAVVQVTDEPKRQHITLR